MNHRLSTLSFFCATIVLLVCGRASADWSVDEVAASRVAARFSRSTWNAARILGATLYIAPDGLPGAWAVTVALPDKAHPVGTVMVNADSRRPPISSAWRGLPMHARFRGQPLLYGGPTEFYQPVPGHGALLRRLGSSGFVELREVSTAARQSRARLAAAGQIDPSWQSALSGTRAVAQATGNTVNGVPDYDWTGGCTPTSTANILEFYRGRGFTRIAPWNDKDPLLGANPDAWGSREFLPGIIKDLRRELHTDREGGTYTAEIRSGIERLLRTGVPAGYGYNFSVEDKSAKFELHLGRPQAVSAEQDTVRSEINSGRPLLWNVRYWGMLVERLRGDVNFDNVVNQADANIFLHHWGPARSGDVCDVNSDGMVNNADYVYCIGLQYFGHHTPERPISGHLVGHSVTVTGYVITDPGDTYFVVHDTWSPAGDVVVNPRDVAWATLITITPPATPQSRQEQASPTAELPGTLNLEGWRVGNYNFSDYSSRDESAKPKGSEVNVRISANSDTYADRADGVDVTLAYDPRVLQVIDEDTTVPDLQVRFNPAVFPNSSAVSDPDNSTIRLSMWKNLGDAGHIMNGEPLAHVRFRVIAQQAYTSAINVLFDRYNTNLTGVTRSDTNANIVSRVRHLAFGSAGTPSIHVTAPRFGDVVPIGLPLTVQWSTANYADTVDLDFSRDGGVNWERVVGSVANTGSYSFVPTDPPTDANLAVLRVHATNTPAIAGNSDTFTLVVPALAAPAGLQAVALSARSVQLSWIDNSSSEFGFFIEQKVGDGPFEYSGYQTSANVTSIMMNGVDPDKTYSFRVQAYDVHESVSLYSNVATVTTTAARDPYEADDTPGQARPIASDFSTQSHTLHPGDTDWVTVSAPAGKALTVETLNLRGTCDTTLSLFDSDGATLLVSNNNANSSATWSRVRYLTPHAGIYYIRVRDVNGGGFNSGYDVRLRIEEPPVLRVTAPNGGERWPVGSTQNIQWTSPPANPTVRILLSRDGGLTWQSMVSGTVNTGSYTWEVSGDPSDQVRVRVQSVDDPLCQDASDSNFSTREAPPAPGSGNGLLGTYYGNQDLTSPQLIRVDRTVDFDWGNGAPTATMRADHFSVRWAGQIQSLSSETYTFFAGVDDGVRLWVNGQLVINGWNDQVAELSGSIALQAGQKYELVLEYYENGGGASMHLLWSSPSIPKTVVPQSQLYSAMAPAPALQSITVSPSAVKSRKSAQLIVTLTQPAGTGGALVRLSSSNTAAALVASQVIVPEGATSATTTVQCGRVKKKTIVTLTGEYGAVRKAGQLTIKH